jgi:hypothetical protein
MAEIHVNRSNWEAISTEERGQIITLLKETGCLKEADSITPSDSVPEFSVIDSGFFRKNLLARAGNPACEQACTTAYAAASARCNLLPHPAARAICFGVATAAYGVCLKNC